MPTTPDHQQVRKSYDTVAEEYRARIADELRHKPLDRALLAALVEQAEPGTPIADLGCGPGHVSAWLAEHGAHPVGIDLSPAMVAIARRDHPELDFRQGNLLQLPASDGEFGAAVALYSVIHLEPAELRPAFTEIRRTLRPGGQLLLAFHVGADTKHLTDWWGHQVDVTFHHLDTDAVVTLLTETGFTVQARLERSHYPQEAQTLRGYVLATRTGDGS